MRMSVRKLLKGAEVVEVEVHKCWWYEDECVGYGDDTIHCTIKEIRLRTRDGRVVVLTGDGEYIRAEVELDGEEKQ